MGRRIACAASGFIEPPGSGADAAGAWHVRPVPPGRIMAAKKKPRHPERLTAPMPWQDFVLGFQIANEALEHLGGPVVKPPFAQPAAAPGRDNPVTWAAVAVARHFGRDYPHLGSFQHRFWALMQLLEGGFVDEWLLPGDDEAAPRRLHPALLLAAAEVPLNRNAKFPTRRFAAHVKEIIRTELDAPAAGDGGAA